MSETATPQTQNMVFAKMLQFGFHGALGALKDDLTQEQATYRIDENTSSIIWNFGHLSVSMDDHIYKIMTGENISSKEFLQKFAMGAKVTSGPDDYPPLQEVVQQGNKILETLCQYLESNPDSVTDAPFDKNHPLYEAFKTARGVLNATPFHIGYHTGQITLLRKAQGLPGGYGF